MSQTTSQDARKLKRTIVSLKKLNKRITYVRSCIYCLPDLYIFHVTQLVKIRNFTKFMIIYNDNQ